MDYDDALFRAQYPEFSDTVKYPEQMIHMFWDVAIQFISDTDNPCSMLQGGARRYALNALTAHLMILSSQASQGPAGAGQSQGGYETGATIGDVSVSRMAPPVKNGWQFWLSQTPYGQQLWAMLSLKAVGGWSVGGLPERTGFRKIGGVFI
jgi:hypothetical protein